jgi:hypothetical protein
MTDMQFSVYGVQREFLGHVHGNTSKYGDNIWSQARTLAAKAYSVAEVDINPVGVKLGDRFLDLVSSSNMSIPQVTCRWIDAPCPG